MKIVFWFTQDLRLKDNPALNAAIKKLRDNSKDGKLELIPIYLLNSSAEWPVQGAKAWWLHHSLASLEKEFNAMGGKLHFLKGGTKTLKHFVKKSSADGVYFSRSYEPETAKMQQELYEYCQKEDVACKRFAGFLAYEPDEVRTGSGNIYKVFTPYYKQCKSTYSVKEPLRKFSEVGLKSHRLNSHKLEDLSLLPKLDWADSFSERWEPGEEGAWKKLRSFTDSHVDDYDHDRDYPAIEGTSQLSPHLHFGEVSPRQVWHHLLAQTSQAKAEPYLRELVWREFSYYLLYHFPHIDEKPFREKFSNMQWKNSKKHLKAWQKGQTGYPIVDAGMRQLWHTGWMHNRVRMIVASFLTKHLRTHWLKGAEWFWDTLVDADLANNSAGWQWVAGSGADAAPYFRIFNPTTQAEKFDKKGEYIRKWVPELKDLPDKYIHEPSAAPDEALEKANVKLGKDYPKPLVNHKEARQEALDAYEPVKNAS